MADTVSFTCPHCSKRFRVAADLAGREARCPKCQNSLKIPLPPAAPRPLAPSAPPPVPPSPGRPARTEPRVRSARTEVNTWLAGLVGAVATVALYWFAFRPLRGGYFGALMMDRGPVQYFITLVTCWGLTILFFKYLAVKRELRAADLELKLIPLDVGLQITPDNVEQFLDHLDKLPRNEQNSILAARIRGALNYFKFRSNVPEVQAYLSAQAELAASNVDQGYTLLRAFIWVCPILGFIGTVIGISDAVTGLAGTLPQGTGDAASSDLGGQMLAGMRLVTNGLAVAFDTTLVGLVAVVILMFPCELLRKIEYAMLDWVEQFSHESLLRRMADADSETEASGLSPALRASLDAEHLEQQRWLATWQVQVGQLGQKIGADVEGAVGHCLEMVAKSEQERMRQLEELRRQLAGLCDKAAREELEHRRERAASQQTWLTTWRTEVQQLGQKLIADVATGFRQVQQGLTANETERLRRWEQARLQVEQRLAATARVPGPLDGTATAAHTSDGGAETPVQT